MKILHTTKSYHPSGGGMYEVTKRLSEELVKLGHDVTVATKKPSESLNENINGVKVVTFNISGNLALGLGGEIKKYQDFLINSDFDIITDFAAQHTLTDAMLPILDKIKAKKVFVPTGFTAFYMKEYKDYFENMRTWFKKYDMNVFLSNDYRDINFARENNVKNITIIPNGASKEEFLQKTDIDIRKKLSIPKDDFLTLHIGSHTGMKGHNESMKIFSKANIKNATFLLVGNDKNTGCKKECEKKATKLNNSKIFKKLNKKIIITTLDRQETVAAYKEADLFLFPSNIECSPIVLFEAMASKTPFLTTDVGNAQEIIKWSGGGILLPTKKSDYLNSNDFLKYNIKKVLRLFGIKYVHNDYKFSKAKILKSAKILESLYLDDIKLEKLSKSGYEAWLKNFTWEKISKDYEKMYLNLLNK